MDRPAWLKQQRRLAQERYDSLFAPTYDEHWGTISPTHERVFSRFLGARPPHALILDAACGTGKYWPMILASGRTVFGIDQSQEMLGRAYAKFPDVPMEQVGLQEMCYREAFDGASCMDAMEFVFPEDWLLVLGNFHRAVKPTGYLYFTVEIAPEKDTERSPPIRGRYPPVARHLGHAVHPYPNETGYHWRAMPLVTRRKLW
jgi:SAM-dependent methyltransferase